MRHVLEKETEREREGVWEREYVAAGIKLYTNLRSRKFVTLAFYLHQAIHYRELIDSSHRYLRSSTTPFFSLIKQFKRTMN